MIEIPENELRMIDDYRIYYTEADAICTRDTIERILRVWSSEKNRWLYDMFGQQLTLSKEVSYEPSIEDLCRDYNNFYAKLPYENQERIDNFKERFVNTIQEKYPEPNWYSYSPQYEIAKNLCNKATLLRNVMEEIRWCPCTFTNEHDKTVVIDDGMKAMRAITKLCDLYSIDKTGLEDLRLLISKVLQKKVKGVVTISIHPLDYMTMSDNNSSWTSCMSWESHGCYREGTVEMMNSPSVVVAYLKGAKPFRLNNIEWNNKTWRSLFIVDPSIGVFSVKNYPYVNHSLTKIVVEWLAELMNSDELDSEIRKYDGDNIFDSNGISQIARIHFHTNRMYNDFGATTHWCIPNKVNVTKNNKINYVYSGESMCMNCGEIDFECNDCEDLVCIESDVYYCECCGRRLTRADFHEGYALEYDGDPYCRDCYDRNFRRCSVCGRHFPHEDLDNFEIYNHDFTYAHDGEFAICDFCKANHTIWRERHVEINDGEQLGITYHDACFLMYLGHNGDEKSFCQHPVNVTVKKPDSYVEI